MSRIATSHFIEFSFLRKSNWATPNKDTKYQPAQFKPFASLATSWLHRAPKLVNYLIKRWTLVKTTQDSGTCKEFLISFLVLLCFSSWNFNSGKESSRPFLPISGWKKQNAGYSPLTAGVSPAGDTKKEKARERGKKKSAPCQLMPPSCLLLLKLVSSGLRLPPSFVLAFLTLPSRTRTYREKLPEWAFLRSANHRRHALIRQHDHKRQSSGPSHAPATRASGWQVAVGRPDHPSLPLPLSRANGPEILH